MLWEKKRILVFLLVFTSQHKCNKTAVVVSFVQVEEGKANSFNCIT
jgi:hypothetical protein